MNPLSFPQFCEQIAGISRMERGKLSLMRQGPNGPYYKLQAWEDGRNLSRYVPADQAPSVQEAIDGYQRFQALTAQYAQGVIAQTRTALAAGSKKKIYRLRRRSAWRRSRKSSP
jgi:hypothetical protein